MTITALPGGLIECGRQGENQARQVAFDPAPFLEQYGPGRASLLVQRPDGAVYPVPFTENEGLLYWTVTARDTAFEGRGRVQLDWRVDETVVRSELYPSYVGASLTENGPPPTDDSGWLASVLEAALRAENAANAVPELAQQAKQEITEHANGEKEALSAHAQSLWQSVADEQEVAEMLDEAFRPAS